MQAKGEIVMVEVPESYRYYRGDRANKAALDLIIGHAGLPPGLDAAEWPSFYRVRLAAERVRTDFYSFLHGIWTETWGHVIDSECPNAKLGRSGDEDVDPSLDSVWSDRSIANWVAITDEHWLWAKVGEAGDGDIQLGFSLQDPSGSFNWSDNVPLSNRWLAVDDDNTRLTRHGLLVIDTTVVTIETQLLREAATEVIQKMKGSLKEAR